MRYINNMMSPNAHAERTMGVIAVGSAVVSAGVGIYSANKNAGIAKTMADDAKAERDKQQAQFQAQQGSQQRANIMQNLRGAAGSSGIAGLAQALANQGSLQTQQISASIGLQEASNQKLAAKGAAAVQTYDRQGQQWVQQAEMDRQATLLGMQMGQTTGANLASQQAQANQMNAQMAQNQAWASGISSVGSTIVQAGQAGMFSGGGGGGGGNMIDGMRSDGMSYDPDFDPNAATGGSWDMSDRKLKKNIIKTGESPSGLNIYSFEFKDSKYGEGLFQGVMSDEIPQEAVSNINGYDRVNYNMLDVEFKQI